MGADGEPIGIGHLQERRQLQVCHVIVDGIAAVHVYAVCHAQMLSTSELHCLAVLQVLVTTAVGAHRTQCHGTGATADQGHRPDRLGQNIIIFS